MSSSKQAGTTEITAEEMANFFERYFEAWGDPMSKDTGDREIDGATTPWEMALVASRRLLALDRERSGQSGDR